MNTFHNIVLLVSHILILPLVTIMLMMYGIVYALSWFVCETVWRNYEDCEMDTWKINDKLNSILTKMLEKISIF